MEASQVTICRASSDYVVGFANGIAVAFWRYNTNAADVPELGAAAIRAHKAAGRPVLLIQIVPASAITPDARARAALVSMLRQLNGTVSHSAIVHEAEGFRAAMIRSIVTGVAAMSNPGFPHRVFANVQEAAAWMSRSSDRFSAIQIAAAVAGVRAAIPSTKGIAQVGNEKLSPRNV